jgi:CO dehydrogenase maturation factor
MATTIAISGKGGSGKTTLTAMIVAILRNQTKDSILAVDADPNSSLGLMMGVEPTGTIAEIREDARAAPAVSAGTDRVRSFEYGIQQAITEADGFDLLTMGRPEGPHCYCAVNNILRTFLDKLSSQYQYVIIDNEAGMEHLSRRTTNNVDLLCIVAEKTPLGSITARRIFQLAKQLPISVKETGIIWNDTKVDVVENDTDKFKIPCFGNVPYDKAVFGASMQGKPIFDLEANSPAFSAVRKILKDKLNLKNLELTKNSKLRT